MSIMEQLREYAEAEKPEGWDIVLHPDESSILITVWCGVIIANEFHVFITPYEASFCLGGKAHGQLMAFVAFAERLEAKRAELAGEGNNAR